MQPVQFKLRATIGRLVLYCCFSIAYDKNRAPDDDRAPGTFSAQCLRVSTRFVQCSDAAYSVGNAISIAPYSPIAFPDRARHQPAPYDESRCCRDEVSSVRIPWCDAAAAATRALQGIFVLGSCYQAAPKSVARRLEWAGRSTGGEKAYEEYSSVGHGRVGGAHGDGFRRDGATAAASIARYDVLHHQQRPWQGR